MVFYLSACLHLPYTVRIFNDSKHRVSKAQSIPLFQELDCILYLLKFKFFVS
jgi:hypothetical protein